MKRPVRLPVALLTLCALVVACVSGCRGQTSSSAPILPLRNMFDQDRYDPQAEIKPFEDGGRLFKDGRTMRKPVEHSIPRERNIDPESGLGRLSDDSGYVLQVPAPVVEQAGGLEKLVTRGHQRYDIYCTPCHDGTGHGKGMVIERGKFNPAPPTFHQDRIRQMPDGQLFATISNGVRMMPAYAPQIPVQDRWAIVSYVRALQLSQGE
jgi:mono/diheme cytochrome c family protein